MYCTVPYQNLDIPKKCLNSSYCTVVVFITLKARQILTASLVATEPACYLSHLNTNQGTWVEDAWNWITQHVGTLCSTGKVPSCTYSLNCTFFGLVGELHVPSWKMHWRNRIRRTLRVKSSKISSIFPSYSYSTVSVGVGQAKTTNWGRRREKNSLFLFGVQGDTFVCPVTNSQKQGT